MSIKYKKKSLNLENGHINFKSCYMKWFSFAAGRICVLFLFACVFFACIGCSGKSDKVSAHKVLLPEIEVGKAIANREIVCLSDYASAIEYVPLESCKEALLTSRDYESFSAGKSGRKIPATKIICARPKLNKCLYSSGHYLMFNANHEGFSKYVCHIFNAGGKYLRSINFETQEEGVYYSVLSNFVKDSKLYVLVDADNRKSNMEDYYCRTYDISTGNLLGSVAMGERSLEKIVAVDSNNIMMLHNFYNRQTKEMFFEGILADRCYGNRRDVFCYKEDMLKVVKEMRMKNPRSDFELTKSSMSATDNGLVMLRELTDTLYKFKKHEERFVLDGFYKLNFADTLDPQDRNIKIDVEKYLEGEKMIFLQTSKNSLSNYFMSGAGIDMYNGLFYCIPTEVLYNDFKKRLQYSANIVFDKITGKTRAVSAHNPQWITGMTNDIDNGAPFWPDIVDDGKMFQVVKAVDFIKLSKIYGSQKMKEVAASLTSDSNPVIVVVTLK